MNSNTEFWRKMKRIIPKAVSKYDSWKQDSHLYHKGTWRIISTKEKNTNTFHIGAISHISGDQMAEQGKQRYTVEYT